MGRGFTPVQKFLGKGTWEKTLFLVGSPGQTCTCRLLSVAFALSKQSYGQMMQGSRYSVLEKKHVIWMRIVEIHDMDLINYFHEQNNDKRIKRKRRPLISFSPQAIYTKIKELNFQDCHTKIRQVDSHSTVGGGVVVQVNIYSTCIWTDVNRILVDSMVARLILKFSQAQ